MNRCMGFASMLSSPNSRRILATVIREDQGHDALLFPVSGYVET